MLSYNILLVCYCIGIILVQLASHVFRSFHTTRAAAKQHRSGRFHLLIAEAASELGQITLLLLFHCLLPLRHNTSRAAKVHCSSVVFTR